MSLYSRSCKSFHIHVLVKHNNVFYRCNKELTFFIEVIKYVALVCFFFKQTVFFLNALYCYCCFIGM